MGSYLRNHEPIRFTTGSFSSPITRIYRPHGAGGATRGSAALIQHAGADAARAGLAPVGPAQVRQALAPAGPDEPDAPLVPQAVGDRSSLKLLRRVGLVDPSLL